jgi:hypothetical protein
METSDTPSVTTRETGIRYGLYLAGVSIVYFLTLTIAGIDMTTGVQRWVPYVFYLGLIFLAHKYFKENGDGFMTYGQGVGISFWLGLVSSVIYGAFFYIYVKFVDASFLDMIKDRQMEEMANRGMTDEQIEQAMQFAGAFTGAEAMLFFAVFFGILAIVICGLIISIFTQRKNPDAIV